MHNKNTKLSIVVPCFNEEKTIEKIIDKIIKYSPYDNEIIVIDDCSNDKSKQILESEIKDKISPLLTSIKMAALPLVSKILLNLINSFLIRY